MNQIQNIFKNINDLEENKTDSVEITVQCIHNRDGSLRWIWPLNGNFPLFLKFYHVQGIKAKCFAFIIKIIFKARLSQYIFKNEKVNISNPTLSNDHDWAMFTGTTGSNQKYLLYQHQQGQSEGTFTKIAFSAQSQHLINNEKNALEFLTKAKNLGFDWPAILQNDDHTISLSEQPSYHYRIIEWSEQHTAFIQSISRLHAMNNTYAQFDEIHQLSTRIKALKESRKKIPSGMIKKLDFLHHSMIGRSVRTHFTHGDFTPWNNYSDKEGNLFVYDWELSSFFYPYGFDFFHFIIQNGVLTQRKSWTAIKKDIDKYQSKLFLHEKYEHYLALYLLVNVLHYLEIYEKQEKWHQQIYWLLETWNLALSELLSSTVNQRELIVLDTFDQLHHQEYVGLKLADQAEKISVYSDLDLIMEKKTSKAMIYFLRQHPLIQKIALQSTTAMTKIMIMTRHNELLSIDHIFQLKRKSLVYMDVNPLMHNAHIDRHGIKKMNLNDTLQFIGLFYGLNNAPIPEKYSKYKHIHADKNDTLNNIINRQYCTGEPSQKMLYKAISELPVNQGVSGMKHKLLYSIDVVRQVFGQKGLMITFSGVDGAGKSTIIENTKKEIEKKMRKQVVIIRHRPSLLPILSAWTKGKVEAEKMAAEKLPRQGQNKHFISSLFRFLYYYIDYFFGQFYIYFKHTSRGHVVLYDRYYFDFIIDSIRSNIVLPTWILRWGYALLIKPDLNFFLYADAKVILSRKKELNESTINQLTKGYLALFKKLGKKKIDQYKAIENIQIEHTVLSISTAIQSKLI